MRHLRGWFHRFVGTAVFSAVVIGGMVQAAASEEEEALQTVREANQHYDDGNFREALRDYRAAYDALDDERLLYRIGLSYDNLSNYEKSREFLELYLERDPDSEVRGRVEATIEQARQLADSVQSYLVVETQPEGAEVYLHGYMGEPAGTAPAEIPVGTGETEVTLVFPEGQRLQVTVDVGSGETVERFFQVGTGGPVATDGEGEEVASTELASVETDQPDEQPPPVEDPDQQESSEQSGESGDGTDPIPTPEGDMDVQLDEVDAGPPWWASALGITAIAAGHIMIGVGTVLGIGSLAEDGPDASPGAVTGSVLGGTAGIAGGIYLLGRNWRGRLPRVEERDEQAGFDGGIPGDSAEWVVGIQFQF